MSSATAMRFRCASLAVLLLAPLVGCFSSTEVKYFYEGRTEDGNWFLLANVLKRDPLIVGRGRHDRLELWYRHDADECWAQRVDAHKGHAVLIKEGAPVLKHHEVRSSGDRIWIIDTDRDAIVAAADLSAEEFHGARSKLPAWAELDAGTVVKNTAQPQFQPPAD